MDCPEPDSNMRNGSVAREETQEVRTALGWAGLYRTDSSLPKRVHLTHSVPDCWLSNGSRPHHGDTHPSALLKITRGFVRTAWAQFCPFPTDHSLWKGKSQIEGEITQNTWHTATMWTSDWDRKESQGPAAGALDRSRCEIKFSGMHPLLTHKCKTQKMN